MSFLCLEYFFPILVCNPIIDVVVVHRPHKIHQKCSNPDNGSYQTYCLKKVVMFHIYEKGTKYPQNNKHRSQNSCSFKKKSMVGIGLIRFFFRSGFELFGGDKI